MAEIRVPAIEFWQKKVRLYLFSMEASRLIKLVRTHARRSDDPEGIQRDLDKKRIDDIGIYVSMPTTVLPNNVIIDFTHEVKFAPKVDSLGEIIFPDDEGHFGNILDGQHRLSGIVGSNSTQKDLVIPVTGLMLDDANLAARIFADINSNQKPVSKVLLVSIQRQLGALPERSDLAAAILEKLNAEDKSPLKGRVKMYQDEKGKYLNNAQMINLLQDMLSPSKTLYHLGTDSASLMLINYLNAVKSIFPDAWNDPKKFYLTRPAGLDVVLGLFERARERTGEPMPSQEQFEKALSDIKDTQWDKETFNRERYTSASGRKALRDELLTKLKPRGFTS